MKELQRDTAMEQEKYTVHISELLQHMMKLQIPNNAKIHYWYETNETPKNKIENKKSWKETDLFGLWEDRKEIKNPTEYVQEVRKPRF